MIILRTLLIVIFSLLLAMVASGVLKPVGSNDIDFGAIIFFVVTILILGPLWPSKNKLQKLNDKFSLPTDNPIVAYPVLMAIFSLVFFYLGLKEYIEPSDSHYRLAGLVYSYYGNSGVIGLWVLIGISCLVATYHGYVKYKNA